MSRRDEVWKMKNKKQYEFEDKKKELEEALDNYREFLVDEAIEDILNVIKEQGKINEGELKLFLGNLALQTKHMYFK